MDKLRRRAASLFESTNKQVDNDQNHDKNDINGKQQHQKQTQADTNDQQQHQPHNVCITRKKSTTQQPQQQQQQQVVRLEPTKLPTMLHNKLNSPLSSFDNHRGHNEKDNFTQKQQQQQHHDNKSHLQYNDCLTPITRSRLATLAQIGEDWLYLALLGFIMALLSFSMDSIITLFLNTRLWFAHETIGYNLLIQYAAWCSMPILLVTFSTGFVHLCSPTAIGSGIPEMKTILRGVVLNEYLTFRTLIAKIVGLTFTLGSGLPLGKEGPSVHMASIVATLLSKLVASFQGIYENESRTSEMLSAACAVGVAATFYAPIGGVLFSIEVTTVYFAVRNYWRGFFAACCGATVWRLLGFWIKNDESISALFKTNFDTDYPFDPLELLVFSFIGVTCGLAGAAYIKFHREIVQFFRRHKKLSGFLQQNRFVYPTLVTLIITSSTFPPLLGQFTASTLSTHTTIEHLFSNRTWGLGEQDLVSKEILDSWTTESTDFHLHLVLYILMLFWTSALASTIPTPSGVFIPVIKIGAAYGRLIGELMASAYPQGVKYSQTRSIIPGSYAVVGAAAFSGAVTHTVSTSVILFEMTGQIVHIIPVILGVLISNAVCQSLQPSIYDSIIEIKKLPYLPPIASSNSVSHRILVRDFMNTNIPFVWKEKCTYADLKHLISTHKKIMSFPLVESPSSMKLLGSVARPDLLKLLFLHLGRERRLQEVCRRNSDTLSPAIHLLNTISSKIPPKLPQVLIDEEPMPLSSSPDTCLRRSESAPQAGAAAVVAAAVAAAAAAAILTTETTVETATNISEEQMQADQTPKLKMDYILTTQNGRNELRISSNLDDTVSTNDSLTSATTKLIVSASRPKDLELEATASNDSGAKSMDHVIVDLPAVAADLQLDKRRISSTTGANKEIQSVAKMINHYDRGTSMDLEQLDKSIQEVEGQLVKESKQPAEILLLVKQKKKKSVESQNSYSAKSQIPSIPTTTTTKQRLQTKSAAYNSYSNNSNNSGNNLSVRPTKSILKASSFNSMTKNRNISTQSFANFSIASSTSSSYNNHNNNNNNNNNNDSGLQKQTSITSQSSYLKFSPLTAVDSSTSLLNASNFNVGICNANNSNNNASTNNDKQYRSFIIGDGSITPTNSNKLATTSNNLNALSSSSGSSATTTTTINATDITSTEQQQQQPPVRRKVRLPRLRVVDMTPEEQEQWEKEQLQAHIDISRCQIDEAPFQLVEQTSLYRVHTLFSMLGLNHAYVTSFGRLVGIVALKDIRYALERMLQEK